MCSQTTIISGNQYACRSTAYLGAASFDRPTPHNSSFSTPASTCLTWVSEAEYVRWVDEHSEEEALTLIDGVLTHWEKVHDEESSVFESSEQYLKLAYDVLSNARNK